MTNNLSENIEKVRVHIEQLKSLSELNPNYFAVEGGAAYIVAKNVQEKMKVNQLRKFFTQIKRIDNELKGKSENDTFDINKTIILLPELAYALGRKLITKEFYDLLKLCLNEDKLPKVKDFKRLVQFLSAILAYHKMLSEKGGENDRAE